MKKLIKTFIAISLLLLSLTTNAQIKVHGDGHISIGSLDNSYGVLVQPSGSTYFASSNADTWGCITMSYTTNTLSKCWIVSNNTFPREHSFFVTGSGIVYRVGEFTISDSHFQERVEDITDASDVLDQMNGFYYTFNYEDNNKGPNGKRNVGFSAQEIEQILPEAVATDEEGTLYLNYEVLTTFLVEGFKEQKREIETLRKILEENGLLK